MDSKFEVIMANISYHVIARSGGKWSVIRTGAERVSGNFPTKKEAVTNAKRLVTTSGGGELIIHERDGRVSKRDSFGGDPSSPENNARNGVGVNSTTVKG